MQRPKEDTSEPTIQDETFGRLIEPHIMAMLRTAAILIGTTSAEDAVQEALVRAWQAWSSLRNERSLHAWLLRITVNVCQDWRRRPSYRADLLAVPLENAGMSQSQAPQYPGSNDHATHLDLQEALDILDPETRLMVMLRYYVGENSSDIGLILNIPPSTVRTRLNRALTRLKDALKPLETNLS